MGVGGESELRHQQQPAADLAQCKTHPALGIGEDAVGQHALEQPLRRGVGVGAPHADQRQHAAVDGADHFAPDTHFGLGDALDESDHDTLDCVAFGPVSP